MPLFSDELLQEFSDQEPKREKLSTRIVDYSPPVPTNKLESSGTKTRSSTMKTVVSNEFDKDQLKTSQQHLAELVQSGKDVEKENLKRSIQQSPVQTQEDGEAVVDVAQGIEDRYNQPHGAELSMTNQVDDVADNVIKDQRAVDLHMSNEISRLGEDNPWYEQTSNVLGLIFLNDISLDVSRVVAGSVLENPSAYFNSIDVWTEFRRSFRDLSPEDQRTQFDLLVPRVLEATDDNTIKARELLGQLLTPFEEHEIIQTIDKAGAGLDVLTLGFPLTKAAFAIGVSSVAKMVGISKQKNILNAIRASGDVEKSSKMAAIVLEDSSGQLAKELNVPFPEENVMPFKFNSEPEELANITHETLGFLHAIKGSTAKFQNNIVSTAATKEEIQALSQREIKLLGDDPELDNVRLVGSDGDNLTFTMDKTDEFGNISQVEYKSRIDPDVVKTPLKTEKVSASAGIFASPAWKFASDKMSTVVPATEAIFQQAAMKGQFNALYKDALKPLGGKFSNVKEKNNLDAILQFGDDFVHADGTKGAVYTYDDLVSKGIRLSDDAEPVKLSDAGYQSYVRLRGLMDLGYDVKNLEMRSRWVDEGLKAISIGDTPSFGKPILERTGANDLVGSKVYNKTTGNYDEVTSGYLDELYNSNKVIIRLRESVATKLDEAGNAVDKTTVMVTKLEDMSELPARVLHRKVGYVPRQTKDAFYFFRENKFGSVNGKTIDAEGRPINIGHSTVAVAANKRDLDALRTVKIKEALDELPVGLDATAYAKEKKHIERRFQVLADRAMSEEDLLRDGFGFSGGLMTGARKEGGLRTPTGDKVQRVSSYESTQTMLNSLSHSFPIQDLRKSLMNRWVATAKYHNAFKDARDTSFAGGRKNLADGLDEEVRRSLEQFHDYVNHVIRVPTDSERNIASITRGMAQAFEFESKTAQHLGDPVAKLLHKLDHRDPISVLKGLTFTTMLGGYNTAQMFVQGFGGMVISGSLSPSNVLPAFKGAWALNVFDQLPSKAARDLYIEVSRKAGKEVDSNLLDAWGKSGLVDDVLSDADLTFFMQTGNTMSGLFSDATRHSTYYYRMGELANRRFTFSSAVDWYRKENKLGASHKFDKIDMRNIMQRHQEIGLNLTRANKARFQEDPIASAFTQFQQVGAKYTETMLEPLLKGSAESTLTKSDIGRLFVLQSAMFGTKGIPMFNNLAMMMAGYAGMRPEDLDPETMSAIEGGFTEWIFQRGGIDVEAVNRLAPATAITDAMTQQLLGNPSSSAFDLLGASGSTVKNFLNAGGSLWDAVIAAGTLEPEIFVPIAKSALIQVSNILASSNHAFKAQMYLDYNIAYDARGRTIAFPDEYRANMQTAIAQALGLGIKVSSDLWKLQKATMDRQEVLNGKVDVAARIIRDNDLYLGSLQGSAVALHLVFGRGNLSQEEADSVMKSLDNRLFGNSKWERIKGNFESMYFKGGKINLNEATVSEANK